LQIDSPPIVGFRVTDNGIGLDDDNFDSFNTAFSAHKFRTGGKGLGRFTWLKAFERAEIESTFQSERGFETRAFTFDENYDMDERGLPKLGKATSAGTHIELVGLRQQYHEQCPRSPDVFIQKLIEHFIPVLLEPDCPHITVHDLGRKSEINDIFEKDYKATASLHNFEINGQAFTLHGFRLPTSRTTKHKLVYAADQRSVLSDKLSDHMPNLVSRLEDEDGKPFFYLGVVQSPYLSDHVNINRTDFDFGTADDADLELPLGQTALIPKVEIRNKILPFVEQDLKDVIESLNAAKLDRIRRYVHEHAPQYRILLKNPERFLDKLTPTPSRPEIEAALHRELFVRERTPPKAATGRPGDTAAQARASRTCEPRPRGECGLDCLPAAMDQKMRHDRGRERSKILLQHATEELCAVPTRLAELHPAAYSGAFDSEFPHARSYPS
jgi:hypothetical protein